jgi:hypothetical protein
MTVRPMYAPARALKRAAALLAVTLTLAHPPPPARAQGEAEAAREARDRFQRGVEFYKEGDFRAALLEFRRAYDVAPNYVVLFNIGQSHYELQDYVGAKAAFEIYLREGGASVPPDRRRQVEAELARLASRIAYVEVKTNVEGADVLVDDVPAAKTPLRAPLAVSAGRRKLTLVKAPSPPVTKYVDVASGVREVVELVAVDAAASASPRPARPSPDPAAARPEGAAPSYAPVWVGLAATGVLAAGAAGAGVLTLTSRSRLDERLDRAPTDEASVGSLRDDVRRWSLVTDVTAGAAVVAGGVTLYLFLSRRADRPQQGHAAPATGLAVGPRGLTLSGRF